MADEPIIRSLLDTDEYIFPMAYIAWKYYRDVPVRYAFKNRTVKVVLPEFIDENELRAELNYVCSLHFTPDELLYRRKNPHIPKNLSSDDIFFNFLGQLRLSPLEIVNEGSFYRIEVPGSTKWPEGIFWEIFILSIVSELYFRGLIRKRDFSLSLLQKEGERRLREKIAILKRNPRVKIIEFATRRRAFREWQERVAELLLEEVPNQLLGISNVGLARKFGIRSIGTFAHQMYMVLSGVYHGNDQEIQKSHNKVLQLWWQEYGEPLSIALTDTYGTDFFFRDFTDEQARSWRGLRQDSGDPLVFGERAIEFYTKKEIDPKTKTIVFSDGLDIKTILELQDHFKDKINIVFGWGTNLTNDLGLDPLSLVVKPVEACGHGLVKLSDNFSKAIGNPENIERFKKIFGYTGTFDEPCRY